MSRVRHHGSEPHSAAQNHNQSNRQTAAAYHQESSGCLSFYLLPPLSVLFFGVMIAIILINIPVQKVPSQTSNSYMSNRLAPLFTPEVQYWTTAILRWSVISNLDPNLIATVMQIESCGDAFARSSAGAVGLFQVMPFHFASTDNPFDPDTNALRGLMYLQRVFDAANQNVSWSLAAYNGGQSLIGLNEWMWPAETIRYVYWGSGIYADAVQMRSSSQRLEEWLAAGGASLCRQANQQLGLP
ncbi:MAG: lytic transglycosylase domain-containing protein [Anaerolineales bacterium]